MSWQQGRGKIDELIASGELQRVPADVTVAHRLLQTARGHLGSASEIRSKDPEGAYAVAYDAARKACAALLQAQGLRPTSRGGHIALRDSVLAQFVGLTGGQALRPFDRLRRRRNETEYPSGESTMDDEEIAEAIARSEQIVEFAEKLVDSLPIY
jgi:hypothetical protein